MDDIEYAWTHPPFVTAVYPDGEMEVIPLDARCTCGLTLHQHITGWPACKGFTPAEPRLAETIFSSGLDRGFDSPKMVDGCS